MRSTTVRPVRPVIPVIIVRTACLLGLFTLACGPKPAEQPAPSPQPAVTTAATPVPVAETSPAGEAGACAVDADCVPAGCCHSTACVPASEKPNCMDTMCTMNCQPDTLDCGGRCACEAGSCKAILNAT